MKLPSFRPRNKPDDPVPSERIFAEARELARLRLEECMADLHERLSTPEDTVEGPERSTSEDVNKAA